jgi:hypothetical protein
VRVRGRVAVGGSEWQCEWQRAGECREWHTGTSASSVTAWPTVLLLSNACDILSVMFSTLDDLLFSTLDDRRFSLVVESRLFADDATGDEDASTPSSWIQNNKCASSPRGWTDTNGTVTPCHSISNQQYCSSPPPALLLGMQASTLPPLLLPPPTGTAPFPPLPLFTAGPRSSPTPINLLDTLVVGGGVR